jgi:hypothetical protein
MKQKFTKVSSVRGVNDDLECFGRGDVWLLFGAGGALTHVFVVVDWSNAVLFELKLRALTPFLLSTMSSMTVFMSSVTFISTISSVTFFLSLCDICSF